MIERALSAIAVISPKTLCRIIKTQMENKIPFNRLLGIELIHVGDGVGEARLDRRDALLNHVGTMHATAIFGLAEASSGCAMAGAIAPHILTATPVASHCAVRYLKPARTDLRALSKVAESPELLREKLQAEGKILFDVIVEVLDSSDELIAEIQVTWHVSLRSKQTSADS